MIHKSISSAALVLATPLCAWAQSGGFSTPGPASGVPGTPSSDMSQADRFTSGFNPTFGLAIDLIGSYVGDDSARDGYDLQMRGTELTAATWIDPRAWAYVVFASSGGAPDLEEASVQYVGLEGSAVVRLGRFFVDFGKQMKWHIHDLRTIDRPAVLTKYLGEEVKGDGIELDDWWALGDSTAVRASLGGFKSLIPEADPNASTSNSIDERTNVGDLNWTARVTGFTDVGESGVFQLGASARLIPNFTALNLAGTGVATDLQSFVYGADATYGWKNDTGERGFSLTGEWLTSTQDSGVDGTSSGLSVFHDDVSGFYVEGDYDFSRFNSVGAMVNHLELPEAGKPTLNTADVYYTHALSEFQRIRFGVTGLDEDGNKSVRVAVQYTAFMGGHMHDINW